MKGKQQVAELPFRNFNKMYVAFKRSQQNINFYRYLKLALGLSFLHMTKLK